jgi:hypothetical protein
MVEALHRVVPALHYSRTLPILAFCPLEIRASLPTARRVGSLEYVKLLTSVGLPICGNRAEKRKCCFCDWGIAAFNARVAVMCVDKCTLVALTAYRSA